MPVILDDARVRSLQDLIDFCAKQGVACNVSPANVPMPAIAGIGTLANAGPSEITFLSNPRYQAQLAHTRAAAVIVTPDVERALDADDSGVPAFVRVVCEHPYLAYALLARWFDAMRHPAAAQGIHASAVVDEGAQVHPSASIGANCVIEAGATIAARTVIGAGCIVGRGSSLGEDCLLHPRVTLYHDVHIGARAIIHSGAVLGADGFGFAPDPRQQGAWFKIAQLGGVIVGDDVEIGANTTIDRGALDSTQIGDGVKLDNQIMVAHNVRIGAHTAIAACVGIAGSTVIGQRCTVGGAAMLSGHLTLVDDVHISGGTAVTSSINKPGRYTGVYPYAEHVQWQKNAAVIQQLSQLRKRIRAVTPG